jgi:hypothetical protein
VVLIVTPNTSYLFNPRRHFSGALSSADMQNGVVTDSVAIPDWERRSVAC